MPRRKSIADHPFLWLLVILGIAFAITALTT